MATNYPSSLDNGTSLPYPSSTDDLSSPNLAAGQGNQNDSVIALETLLGTNSTQTSPVANTVLTSPSNGTNEWQSITSSFVSGSTGTGNFVLASSPTISSPTISSPTISSPTITGSLGNISAGTITASGLITANNGLDVTSGTITLASGSVPTTALTNPYKFSVYRNASFTGSSGSNIIIFDTEVFDTGSNYSTSTGKFTAPIAGFYFFVAGLDAAVNNGGWSQLELYRNGADTTGVVGNGVEAYQTGSAQPTSVQVSGLLQLSANDYIQVNWITNGVAIYTGQAETYFQGFLISAT